MIQSVCFLKYRFLGNWSKFIWLHYNISPGWDEQAASQLNNIWILAILYKDWTCEQHVPLAPLSNRSAASICRGLGGSLQGPPDHLQGSFLGLVPANKASSVDEDAALNPTELRQRFIPNAAPLFWQGQPGKGRQMDTMRSAVHFLLTHYFLQKHTVLSMCAQAENQQI